MVITTSRIFEQPQDNADFNNWNNEGQEEFEEVRRTINTNAKAQLLGKKIIARYSSSANR
jgi:hypothetical protein